MQSDDISYSKDINSTLDAHASTLFHDFPFGKRQLRIFLSSTSCFDHFKSLVAHSIVQLISVMDLFRMGLSNLFIVFLCCALNSPDRLSKVKLKSKSKRRKGLRKLLRQNRNVSPICFWK